MKMRPYAVIAAKFRPFLTVLGLAIALTGRCEGKEADLDALIDLPLDQLVAVGVSNVTTASKYEQKSTTAPAFATVITAEEIRRYGWLTLNDALASVPGLYVTNSRNYEFLGVRGFSRPGDYNSRVLLLIDGHRVNDTIFGSANTEGIFPLDLDLVERIEVIRGPGSSIYGSGAFFAVINVIPKSARDFKGGEIAARAGSFQSIAGRATAGQQYASGLEILGSYTNYSAAGNSKLTIPEYADDPMSNFGRLNANSDSERWNNAYLGLKKGGLKFMALQSDRRKNYGTGLYASAIDGPSNRTSDGHQALDLQYERAISADTSVFARSSYHWYRYRGDSAYAATPDLTTYDNGDSKWWSVEARILSRVAERHRVTTGLEYISAFYNRIYANDSGAPNYLDLNKPYQTLGLFAQDEIQLSPSWSVTVGLRHDRLYLGNNATSPRFAAIYSPSDKTAVKLLFGEAFRAPNQYELNFEVTGYKGNPSLRPERIRTVELVLEQALSQNVRGTASLFDYRVKNLISSTTDPNDGLIQFQNRNNVNARGLDLALEGRWGEILARGSMTLQQAHERESDQRLSNSPRHLAKFNVSVPLLSDRTILGFETQYVSSRLGTTTTGLTVPAGSYAISNISLVHKFGPRGLELSAGIWNLFDRSYFDPRSEDDDARLRAIPQDGRTFWIKGKYAF